MQQSLGVTGGYLIACTVSYKLGLTASQVVRLVDLLLVFASQKIVHNVRDKMA